jgi:hypothetical protein
MDSQPDVSAFVPSPPRVGEGVAYLLHSGQMFFASHRLTRMPSHVSLARARRLRCRRQTGQPRGTAGVGPRGGYGSAHPEEYFGY